MLVAALGHYMWGRALRGAMALAPLCLFSVTPSTTHNQIGPLWCCFPGGWVCARSRPLWVSPTTSAVRLGVSPAAASTPMGVFNQRFEALFPCAGILGCSVCPVTWSTSCCLASQLQLYPPPLHSPPPRWVCQLPPCRDSSPSSCPSLPLLPVWMNVSSLSPWLLDFHTV